MLYLFKNQFTKKKTSAIFNGIMIRSAKTFDFTVDRLWW